jgi:hypothetical protein
MTRLEDRTPISTNKLNGFTGPKCKITNIYRMPYGFTGWEGERLPPQRPPLLPVKLQVFDAAVVIGLVRWVNLPTWAPLSYVSSHAAKQGKTRQQRKSIQRWVLLGIVGFYWVQQPIKTQQNPAAAEKPFTARFRYGTLGFDRCSAHRKKKVQPPCQFSASNTHRVNFTRHQIFVGMAPYIWRGVFFTSRAGRHMRN